MKIKQLCCLMLSSLLIVGCSSNEPKIVQQEKNNDTATINFLIGSLSKKVLDYMQDVMLEFHDANPGIDVAYEAYQQNQGANKSLADLIEERIKNNEATDVACMDVKNIFDFVNKDKLVDLSDLSFSKKLLDIAKKDSTINGKVYSVPASLVSYCMYVNMDILKECGLSKPNNWEEFLHCCEVLKQKGYQPIVGTQKFMKLIIYAGGLSTIYTSDHTEEIIKKLNSGEEAISTYVRPGFEMLQELLDKGYLDGEEALKYLPSDLTDVYNQGKGCFAFTYSSFVDVDKIPFDFDLAGIPTKDGHIALIASERRMSVFSNSKHVEECKKFVNFFSEEDIQKKTLASFGKFPAYKDVHVTLDKRMSDIQKMIDKEETMLIQDYNLKFEQWDNLDALCDGLLGGKSVDEQLAAFDAIQQEAIK